MFFRWFEHNQVYHPTTSLSVDPSGMGRPWEEVRFQASDGVPLHGWFFPAKEGASRSGFTFLFCHGNGGNISHRLAYYELILETGAGLLGFDYRGYGRSGGRPSEAGTYRDAEAAWEWLVQRGCCAEGTLVYGESLGGGVASHLVLNRQAGGLVLQSTFTSIPDIGKELFPWLPVRSLATIHYPTRERLPRVQVPVIIMHSRDDRLIGFHHAESNFAAANEPKLLWEIEGNHNDQPQLGTGRFREGLDAFLGLVERSRSKTRS